MRTRDGQIYAWTLMSAYKAFSDGWKSVVEMMFNVYCDTTLVPVHSTTTTTIATTSIFATSRKALLTIVVENILKAKNTRVLDKQTVENHWILVYEFIHSQKPLAFSQGSPFEYKFL